MCIFMYIGGTVRTHVTNSTTIAVHNEKEGERQTKDLDNVHYLNIKLWNEQEFKVM